MTFGNPESGFSLTFSDTKVAIEGENPLPLFHYLREHRAAEITKADRSELMQAKGECVVSKILVVTPK